MYLCAHLPPKWRVHVSVWWPDSTAIAQTHIAASSTCVRNFFPALHAIPPPLRCTPERCNHFAAHKYTRVHAHNRTFIHTHVFVNMQTYTQGHSFLVTLVSRHLFHAAVQYVAVYYDNTTKLRSGCNKCLETRPLTFSAGLKEPCSVRFSAENMALFHGKTQVFLSGTSAKLQTAFVERRYNLQKSPTKETYILQINMCFCGKTHMPLDLAVLVP